MRKLVTIRTITSIRPINGADFIECAHIDGWQVVVKKNEFKPGDPCVFFEIDSVIPLSDSRFDFLQNKKITYDNRECSRLKTIKLRKQISQGLALPLNVFPELACIAPEDYELTDMADILNVVKYEPPIPVQLAGDTKGPFPCFIKKTDQERIQNLPDILETYGKDVFEITEKLDGSSMTVYKYMGEKGVCSRNQELKETESNTFWRVTKANKLMEALDTLGRDLALQGELIGEGIQGNPHKIKGQNFFLFDILNLEKFEYLSVTARGEVLKELSRQGFDIKTVPLVGHVSLNLYKSTEEILAAANSQDGIFREGLVFKRMDGAFSFKAISNNYLLNEK